MMEQALSYVARGYAVIPLHTTDGRRCSCPDGDRCTSPGKHPRNRAGVTEASSDPSQVREWWRRWPDAWVGIATGEASGVWVLDVDTKGPPDGQTGTEAYAQLVERHGLAVGLQARTGSGGLHVYFAMPEDGRQVRNRQGLRIDGPTSVRTGIDVRGTGGYVVAPPAGHHSGGRYEWLTGADSIPLQAPAWLLELVAPAAPTPSAYTAPTMPAGADRSRRFAQRLLEGILQDIATAPAGGRHELLNRKAYKLGGYAHLLGGVDGLVPLLVDAFLAATGDPKREREARRTALDGLRAGAARPLQVPDRQQADRPVDPTWREAADVPEDDDDIPVDESWHAPSPGGHSSDGGTVDSPRDSTDRGGVAAPESGDDTGDNSTAPDAGRMLPTVRVNRRQMRHVLADAWSAVRRLPAGRGLYQQDGRLVRVLQSESGPRVEPVDSGWLTSALVGSARWVKLRKATAKDVTAAGQEWVETDCDRLPSYVVQSMVGAPRADLPVLERVERAPYVDPAGELVDVEGYRPDTRTYLGPHEPVASMPIDQAVDLLREWLIDFPFARRHDAAHVLGFLMTPIVRSMIRGPVPIHVFEAPQRGTGKTLLMECVARVAAGYSVSASKLASNDEERRKSLVAHLLAGSSMVLLDNVTGRVDDDTLAGILTAYPRYSDRKMGGQSLIWAPARAVWALSGNNMSMSTDIARRAVVIRLDARMERPEQRQTFRIANLRRWTEDNAGRLRGAALAVVQHWVALGMPASSQRLGSYEEWSRIVGGIVSQVAPGWLEGREERLRDADPEREDWRRLIRGWLGGGMQARRASEVADLARDHDLLLHVLGDGSKLSQARRMSSALRGMRGVVLTVDGEQRQIEPGGTGAGRSVVWRVSGGPSRGVVHDINAGG